MAAYSLNQIWSDLDDAPKRPACHYSAAGDCLYIHWDEAESYAERLDGVLTVYRAFDTDKVVGLQIKSVSKLAEKCDQFGYLMPDGYGGSRTLGVMILASGAARLDDFDPSVLRDISQQQIDLTQEPGVC